ncbi:hypothetical protein ACM3BN_12910 [Mammaliicoccus sciuri]
MEHQYILGLLSINSKFLPIVLAPLISGIFVPLLLTVTNKIMTNIKYSSNSNILIYSFFLLYGYSIYLLFNIYAIIILYKNNKSSVVGTIVLSIILISVILIIGNSITYIRIYNCLINKFHIIKEDYSYRILFQGFKNLLNDSVVVSNGLNFDKHNENTYLINEDSRNYKERYRVEEKIIRLENGKYITLITYYRTNIFSSFVKINGIWTVLFSILIPIVQIVILLIFFYFKFHVLLVGFSLLIAVITTVIIQMRINSKILIENRDFKVKVLKQMKSKINLK